jgi:hypothetical protein
MKKAADLLLSQQERIEALESELESHAWEISPAMAQAKIDQLNAANEALEKVLRKFRDHIIKVTASTTHYEGCEANHINCAWLKQIDAALSAMPSGSTK